MAIQIAYWPGSSSFFPGDTTQGYYDNDPVFQQDIEKFAKWAARRLGYPIMDVELQDVHFFDAFEEAVSEYSKQINTFNTQENIYDLLGYPTGSANLNNTYIEPNLDAVFKLSTTYGTAAGSGGNLTWYTGSFTVQADKQVYDLLTDTAVESGSLQPGNYTIRKLIHKRTPAITRFGDPYSGNATDEKNLLEGFGWGDMSSGIDYLMMPLHYDLLRAQAVEFNDHIRKSSYGFQITNNRIRIFPRPTESFKIWFLYTIDDENSPGKKSDNKGKITDLSNIPYGNLQYRYINDMGKQWIRRYALAIAKETLGNIRGKYETIPTLEDSFSMNSSDLISSAQTEQDRLIEELLTSLEGLTRASQMEKKNQISEYTMDVLRRVPMKIFVR